MDQRIDELAVAVFQTAAGPVGEYGARLMLSMPPAATISASPALIAWAPSMAAFSPEPQTLLTVYAAIVFGQARRIGRPVEPGSARRRPERRCQKSLRRPAPASHWPA